MAIGLGRMFGFHFQENFNYPYVAASVSDFWRRWHISLSSWFRDYVYIPLGGNRVSTIKWVRNFALVWLLTGLWHGANYTFILWGVFYGSVLIVEKLTQFPKRFHRTWGKVAYRVLTLLLIMCAWVLFRAESLALALQYLKSMFWWNHKVGMEEAVFWISEFKWFLIAGIVLAFPILPKQWKENKGCVTFRKLCLMIFFFVSISYLAKGSYNPFIYFNF